MYRVLEIKTKEFKIELTEFEGFTMAVTYKFDSEGKITQATNEVIPMDYNETVKVFIKLYPVAEYTENFNIE